MCVGFVRADFIIVAIYQEFAFLWAHHFASAFSFLGLGLPQTEPALTLSPVGSQNGVTHSISKIEYRAMLGGNLSPTPTARMLFSQAQRSAPVSNTGATRK